MKRNELESLLNSRGNSTPSHPDIIRCLGEQVESHRATAQGESNQNILSINIVSGFKEAFCELDKFPVIYFQVLIVLEEPPY